MLWMLRLMKRKRNGLFYSKKEETINSISHGIGIAMGVIVSTLFLIKCYQAQNLWAACGVWLYLFGMGGSYLASTLYHSLKHHNPWKRRLRHWDHAAIYWHIAGSYSPHHTHCIERGRRLGLGTFRLRLAMRHHRYCCQLPQDGGAQLRGNSMLHPDGAVRTGSIQAAFRPLPHSLLLDYCRGGMLHHGSRLLLLAQSTVHAFGFPFLCIGRFSLPHGGCMGHTGEDAVSKRQAHNR